MSSSGLDAYQVVTAKPPDPPQDPDPQAAAREAQQAMFGQEKAAAAWTAPLSPGRASRQRLPVPAENAAEPEAPAAERQGMCILRPDGAHASRGLHCPHDLPEPGEEDSITRIDFWA